MQIPKVQKDTDDLTVFFALLGFARIKVVLKHVGAIDTIFHWWHTLTHFVGESLVKRIQIKDFVSTLWLLKRYRPLIYFALSEVEMELLLFFSSKNNFIQFSCRLCIQGDLFLCKIYSERFFYCIENDVHHQHLLLLSN